jgi:outer membrane protein assembly factor BamB
VSNSRKKGLVRLAVLIALVLGAIVAITVYSNRDVNNPNVAFEAPPPPQKKSVQPETFVWPMYGYDKARTKALAVSLEPPFRPKWRFNANQLLEFSPILARGTLYFARKDATVFAVDARTGRRQWARQVGSLSAASPAYADGRIFVSTLSGRVVSLDAETGRAYWGRKLGSRTESSPLVLGKSIVVGSEGGKLYRLRQRDGRVEWTYDAGGAIKGGPAYHDGKVIVGAYGGTVHAVRASGGGQVWRSSTSGARFGFGSGNFYATPAVAYGRVFIGNTDGKVYSFSADSGRLGWSKGTGSYVYAGAAVENVRKVGPTVFVGSYDGTFYALNARTGGVRWSYSSGGQISGAPTVIGDVVYFSTINTTSTFGLSTRSGRRVFFRDSGAYNPMISDGKRLYWTGYESVSALVPKRR